jgi:hypothetical protein
MSKRNRVVENPLPEVVQVPPELAGATVTKLTGRDAKNAADDANFLMTESASVRGLVLAMIITRRVYMLLDRALRVDIAETWDMTNPDLVMHTLAASAEKKALEPTTVAELFGLFKSNLEPILEMYMNVEKEAANGGFVPGHRNESTGGLGEDLQPLRRDESNKAGLGGEGNSGEGSAT